MKLITVATGVVLGISLVSCNENQPPKSEAPVQKNNFLAALQGGQVTYSPNVSNTQGAATGRRELDLPGAAVTPPPDASKAPAEPAVQIPKDARWTLYCASVSGADRFSRMAQMKAYLVSNSPFKDWYVVHNEQDSTLFYGFYSAVEKADRSAAKAQDDRKRISEWKDETGERPFATCFFTPITPPSPAAPPEWSLSNAPARAYWSVQIAAFRDNPQRKQAAVEAVKELRGKGVEAYYFHGQSISSVCVGAWPADAVKGQDIDGSHAIADPDDALLVSDAPLPERYQNARLKTNDGQRIVPFAQRTEIADKSLIATLKEFPYHYVNYQPHAKSVKTADGKMQDRIDPSFLVKIPREDASMLNGGQGVQGFMNSGGAANAPPAPDPSRQPAGTGRLKGLGF